MDSASAPLILRLKLSRSVADAAQIVVGHQLVLPNQSETILFEGEPTVTLDWQALSEARGDPQRYGALLSRALFAAPQLVQGLAEARSQAAHAQRGLRLVLEPAPDDASRARYFAPIGPEQQPSPANTGSAPPTSAPTAPSTAVC